VRRLVLALDAIPALRESAAVRQCSLRAAASLAELAGVGALRVGICEDLQPVAEVDVAELRRSSRCFELRMPANTSLLKVALEARPDRVVLSATGWGGQSTASPLDLRSDTRNVSSVIRSLEEAGTSVVALISPDLESVKAAHSLGVRSIEFFTGAIVDLPEVERVAELEKLGDAARIASKLRMVGISVGGGLDYSMTTEILEAAPVADRVVAGRAVMARSLLVGIDRAVRDFRELLHQS
jgi:pyridoxine 5-phosphate synthase